jgi:sterol desaturase/sphingolipid hydroxylase (fatty acid hydroxylase superfamily)
VAALAFLAEALAWVPACLLALAAFEYAGHRWPLHHRFFVRRLGLGRDHAEHHGRFARDFEYAPESPAWYDRYAVRLAFGLLWPLPAAVPLALWGPAPLALCLTASAGAHAVLWQWLHNQMHRPSCRRLSATRYFRFARDFHRAHHDNPRTNFGFVFAPLFDSLFRTRNPSENRNGVRRRHPE